MNYLGFVMFFKFVFFFTCDLICGEKFELCVGSILYIKREMKLESEPTIEGLIVAMSLIGATLVTTFSGAVSDSLGRRPMLIISSVLYFFHFQNCTFFSPHCIFPFVLPPGNAFNFRL